MAPSTQSSHGELFEEGQVLEDRFRVVRFIARGGMGEVYEAEDLELGERIALKTVRADVADDEIALRRFRREIRLARSVSHPNVCRVFDLFQLRRPTGGIQLVLTMELLRGRTLARRIAEKGSLEPAEAGSIARQVAAGLEAAHAAGVIHRDLKSDNVFLVPSDLGTRAVITDFGLALAGEASSEGTQSTVTATRGIAGTPAYMAPEQLEGEPATEASDIYALGVILFEMLTGERPFVGSNPISAAYRRLVEPPRRPSDLMADLDPGLEGLVLGCLERDPEHRPAGATAVVEILDGQRPAPSAAGRTRGWRHWAAIGGIAAAVLMSLTALWMTGIFGSDAPRATQRTVVAVLPAGNLGHDDETGWLSVALGEMLRAELSSGEQLSMVPSESTATVVHDLDLPLSGGLSKHSLSRLRRVMPSDLVVQGTYLSSPLADGGTTLRLDIHAQDVRTGEIVATASAEGPGHDLFGVVDRVGREILSDLGMPLVEAANLEPLRTAMPADPEAARAYATGLQRLRLDDGLGAQEALAEAVRLAPDFAMARAAMARAWQILGYSERAQAEAQRAYDLSSGLRRESRLAIEAQLRETEGRWNEAASLYESLWTFFPETDRYGIALAEAQLRHGDAIDALQTVVQLTERTRLGASPRLMLVEARCRYQLSEYAEAERVAGDAAVAAEALVAPRLAAQARLLEAHAMWHSVGDDRGVAAYQATLDAFTKLGDLRGRAETLISLARCERDLGRLDRAEAFSRRSLAVARELGSIRAEGEALAHLGSLARLAGDLAEADTLYVEALSLAEASGDRRRLARLWREHAMILRRLDRLDDALGEYQRAHDVLLALGDRSGASSALTSIAVVRRQMGDLESAVAALERSLDLKREVGDLRSMSTPLVNLANIHLQLGNLEASAQAASEALSMARQFDSRRHETYALVALGEVSLARGDLAAARRHHELALELREDIGETSAAALSRLALAVVDLESGRADDAIDRVRNARRVFEASGEPALQLYAMAVQIDALTALDRTRRAREILDDAVALAEDIEDTDALQVLTGARAGLALATGRHAEARRLYQSQLDLAEANHSMSDRLAALLGLARTAEQSGDQVEAAARAAQLAEIAEKYGFMTFHRDALDLTASLPSATGTGD
jgi:tetratricopeptide (TPR) repeat protein/tRNA A-37 threonylcarbamoyl transferase component Bud32/TolB-like protein